MSRLGILIAIGVILLLILLIAISAIRFRVTYSDELVVVVRFWVLKIRLYPRKRKRPASRNFKTKRFRKWIRRNISRADKKSEKAKRKAERKKVKKDKAKKKQMGGGAEVAKKGGAKLLIRLFARIFKGFIEKFPKYLKIKVNRLVIGVATDDAANTAIAYGYTVQAAQYLIEFVKVRSSLCEARGAVVSVYPDFTTEKSRVELDVTFSIRVWQVISLGLTALKVYVSSGKGKKNGEGTEKALSLGEKNEKGNNKTGDVAHQPV